MSGGAAAPGGRILQLDPAVVARVAAGEVIHGPSGVVKELLENALDAGASHVTVTLERGGRDLVAVADDGAGIEREDLPLALERHATSKLRTVQDLAQLDTLGFRGEALAAMAQVATVTVTSRVARPDVPHATEVRGTHGVTGPARPARRTAGTTVEVAGLFARVPARARALREPAVEAAAVARTVRRLASARPAVRFTLWHDGRQLLDLTPAPPARRLAEAWGVPCEALLRVEAAEGALAVQGWILDPALGSRGARSVWTVDGRVVENPELRRALARGLDGRRATTDAWLALTSPPGAVDVNVSPTKHVVRLAGSRDRGRGGSDAERLVETAVRRTLTPRTESDPGTGAGTGVGARRARTPLGERQALVPAEPERIGQVDHTFLVLTSTDGILLVDQHAAHERVQYERLVQRAATPPEARGDAAGGADPDRAEAGHALGAPRAISPGVVQLEPPIPLGRPPQEAVLLEARAAALATVGVLVRAEGGQWWLWAHPAWDEMADPAGLAADVAAVLGAEEDAGATALPGLLWDRTLRRLACRLAVKAGTPLDPAERQQLWAAVRAYDLGLSDVHGRPGGVWIDAAEMRSRVGRSGRDHPDAG